MPKPAPPSGPLHDLRGRHPLPQGLPILAHGRGQQPHAPPAGWTSGAAATALRTALGSAEAAAATARKRRREQPGGPPAVYEVNGREYVVIAATGGGKLGTPAGDAYVAFSLE